MHALFEDIVERLDDLFNEMKKAIKGLPLAALDWVPGDDMNSLGLLVVHTCGATRYWAIAMSAEQPVERSREAEFQSQGNDEATLVALLDSTLADVRAALETLTLDSLVREVVSEPHRGRSFRVSWSLMHTLEHAAQHVGHAQITRQMWDANAAREA